MKKKRKNLKKNQVNKQLLLLLFELLIYLDDAAVILKQINPIEPLEIQIPSVQSENVSYHL